MNKVRITTTDKDGSVITVLYIETVSAIADIRQLYLNAQLNKCPFFLQTTDEIEQGVRIVTLDPHKYDNLEMIITPMNEAS